MIRKLLFLATVFGLTISCSHAQERATAVRKADLQVGGGFSYAWPNFDYSFSRNNFRGWTIYADYDFLPHWGIEFDVHQVNGPGSDKSYERTYELGGRYKRRYGRFNPYLKGMYGRGVYNFPPIGGNFAGNLAYNLFTAGAGVDYNLLNHVNVRADYEVQKWLGFPGNTAAFGPNFGMTPQLLTVGAAYRF